MYCTIRYHSSENTKKKRTNPHTHRMKQDMCKKHLHTNVDTHPRDRAHIYPRNHTCIHTQTHTHTRTCSDGQTQTHAHEHTHTHTHTQTDRHTHTHTHTHAHTDGIRREFYLCLLWRRIHTTDNGLSYLRR